MDPRRIAFILEDFALGKPSQQLLDRFLIGYPRDGEFRQFENSQIVLRLVSKVTSEILLRSKEFSLRIVESDAEALQDADAVVIACAGASAQANDSLLESGLHSMKSGARCFVYGRLAHDQKSALRLAKLAESRGIILSNGTATSAAFRLPQIDLNPGTKIREALIVVQGLPLEAEMEALHGLLPLLEKRRHGESGVRIIYPLGGPVLQDALEGTSTSFKRLLAAAISRSDTIQGDPLKDGRTQDVVGLGMVKTLAKAPRGWVMEHADGVRSKILVLDGVLADINFAILLESDEIISAQFYRPPSPQEAHFSQLMGLIDDFFQTGQPPAPIQRGILIADLLNQIEKSILRSQ